MSWDGKLVPQFWIVAPDAMAWLWIIAFTGNQTWKPWLNIGQYWSCWVNQIMHLCENAILSQRMQLLGIFGTLNWRMLSDWFFSARGWSNAATSSNQYISDIIIYLFLNISVESESIVEEIRPHLSDLTCFKAQFWHGIHSDLQSFSQQNHTRCSLFQGFSEFWMIWM